MKWVCVIQRTSLRLECVSYGLIGVVRNLYLVVVRAPGLEKLERRTGNIYILEFDKGNRIPMLLQLEREFHLSKRLGSRVPDIWCGDYLRPIEAKTKNQGYFE